MLGKNEYTFRGMELDSPFWQGGWDEWLHILIFPICVQGSRPSGVRAAPSNACGVVLNLLQKSGRSVGNCSPPGDQIVLCSEISESTEEAEEAEEEEEEEEEVHLSFEMRSLM